MKTQVKHSDGHQKLGYLLFGFVVTLFTLLIAFSFIQQRRISYTGTSLSSLTGRNLATPLANPVTEAQPFNLVELLSVTEEPTLVVDHWMTDLSSWNLATTVEALSFVALEEELVPEDWMFDLSSWSSTIKNGLIVAAIEPVEIPLAIETWMLNTTTWASSSFLNEVAETELAIEDWMLNTDTWLSGKMDYSPVLDWANTDVIEPPINIEDWMLNPEAWVQPNSVHLQAGL